VLLGQAVAGVGGALILPNSVALLTVTFVDPHKRTEAIGLWAASSGLGLAAGPIIGGLLLGHFSWHIVFLTNVVLGLVTLGLGLPAVAESKHPGQRLDPAGLLLGTLAVFALVFASIEGGHHGYASPLIVASFATSAVAAVLFAVVEARSKSPMLDVRLFRSSSFSAVMVVAGVALFGFTGVTLLLVLFFQRVQGLSALDTGWRVLPEMAAFVVASALTGRLVRRTSFRLLLTLGLALGGLASLGLLLEGPTTGYAPVGLVMALFGTGLGFVVASSTAAAMTSVGPAQASMASGALNTFRQVGAVLGTSILGTLLTNRTASDLPATLADHVVPVHDRLPVLLAAAHGTLNPHTMSAQVHAAVGDAFSSGVHAGLVVNAIVFLSAALLAAGVVRHRVHTGV
jgi:predicted MFS family arabinose efflux permease